MKQVGSKFKATLQSLAPFQRKRARRNKLCGGHGAAKSGLAMAGWGGRSGWSSRGRRCSGFLLAAAVGADIFFLAAGKAAHGAQQQCAAGES